MSFPPYVLTFDGKVFPAGLNQINGNFADIYTRLDAATVSAIQWLVGSFAPAYVDESTYTLEGDQTGLHAVGRMVRAHLTGGHVIEAIQSSNYSTETELTTVVLASAVLDDTMDGVELGILTPGADSALPADVVRTFGNQTIAGDKTLTGSLSLPAPTADGHGARKVDVDAAQAAATSAGQAAADGVRLGPNLLINSNFDFDQRGGPHVDPADGDYTLDRWVVDKAAGAGTAPAMTVQQNTVNAPEGSAYCCELVITAAGADGAGMSWSFVQKVEEYPALAGKEVTFSLTIEGSTDIDLAGNLKIYDGVGNTAQAIATVGTTAQRISVTRTLDVSATALYVYFQLANGVAPSATGSIYLSQAKLEIGDIATPYVPPLRADELPRCQRYYEIINSNNRGRYRIYMEGTQELPIPFIVQKRITPTVTPSFAITSGGGTPAVASITPDGFRIDTTPTTNGNKRITCQATVDAEI